MRVVGFEELCSLEDGTVFSYWKPCCADGLYRRGEVFYTDGKPTDFYMASLIAGPNENCDGPVMEAVESRWGEFNYDQLFAIYQHCDRCTIAIMLGAQDPLIMG